MMKKGGRGKGLAACGQCFRKGTPVWTGELERRPIEETRMGQRVMTWLSGRSGPGGIAAGGRTSGSSRRRIA